MKLNFTARSWHTWSSLILALPILIVGATAVFIAHKKALGTDDIAVQAQWLPGYDAHEKKMAGAEPRAALLTRDGSHYVATQHGLYRLQGEQLLAIDALANLPVRALVDTAFGTLAAAKNGLWLESKGEWQRVHKGDAWNVNLRADGSVIASLKDQGLLVSRDGRDWQADPQLSAPLAQLAGELQQKPLTLDKLIMDLHTGKAFLGKTGEWIWIDLVGLAMCLLALTGIYMWWRGEKRKTTLAG